MINYLPLLSKKQRFFRYISVIAHLSATSKPNEPVWRHCTVTMLARKVFKDSTSFICAGVPVNHVNRLGWTAFEAVVLGNGGFLYQKSFLI